MRNFVLFTLFLFLVTPCTAKIIYVDDDGPADFNNIQDAIDSASPDDTVFVKSGYYSPSTNNESFPILMKNDITLQGEDANTTIIDGEVTLNVIETAHNTALKGFTIGGSGSGEWNNVVSVLSSYATIEDNIILYNGGSYGIYCDSVQNILIKNNTFLNWGVYCYNSNQILVVENVFDMAGYYNVGASFLNSTGNITNNFIKGGWFGVECVKSIVTVINNIAIDNMYGINMDNGCEGSLVSNNNVIGANRKGIYLDSSVQVNNNIITDSGEHAVYCFPNASLSDVSYNNFWNNASNFNSGICSVGVGNIFANPLFSDPNNDDYHLQSQTGRWDPNTQTWVIDSNTSPCIDTGDWTTPIGFEPFPNGGRINIGAYGGTAEASKSYFGKSPCQSIIAGDINGDCIVDFKDFSITALHWLEEG